MRLFYLAGALALAAPLFASENNTFELLPKGRPFRLTFADPREIRMALGFEGGARLTAAIGNYFSLFAVSDGESGGAVAHFGLEGAGYFTMREQGSRFPLETTDGLIGAYLEGKDGPWQAQLRYTHISAHLSDGLSGVSSKPYSRETVSLRAGYAPSFEGNCYIGLSYLVSTVPVVPRLGAQIGGSYFFPIGIPKLTPFLAVDLQVRQEWALNPSVSAQLGVALNNPPEAYRSFRFFYSYYSGTDPRGQFRTSPHTAHSLGIEMQI